MSDSTSCSTISKEFQKDCIKAYEQCEALDAALKPSCVKLADSVVAQIKAGKSSFTLETPKKDKPLPCTTTGECFGLCAKLPKMYGPFREGVKEEIPAPAADAAEKKAEPGKKRFLNPDLVREALNTPEPAEEEKAEPVKKKTATPGEARSLCESLKPKLLAYKGNWLSECAKDVQSDEAYLNCIKYTLKVEKGPKETFSDGILLFCANVFKDNAKFKSCVENAASSTQSAVRSCRPDGFW